MAISIKSILSWFKVHYDKLLALVVLAFLLGSLLYLAVMIGAMHSNKEKFEQEIRGYKPRHPNVDKVDTKPFSKAMESIEHPKQMTNEQWTNKMMFVPEKRVWCVDCRKPIPFALMKCSFCNTDQPIPTKEDPKYDSDKDGLPDAWEKRYGLNHLDSGDVEQDLDNDGFTNNEEYMAETDPADPVKHPPITAKLRYLGIVRDPFKLKFKSVVTDPDGKLSFGLNVTELRLVRGRDGVDRRIPETRTHFSPLGGIIKDKDESFTVFAYVQTNEVQQIPGVGPRLVDVSVLTLQQGTNLVALVKNQDVQRDKFTAHLLFTVDKKRYVVKAGQVIDLRGEKFKVINIDIVSKSVLLESLNDGLRTAVSAVEAKAENRKAETNDSGKDGNVSPSEKQDPAAKQGEDSI